MLAFNRYSRARKKARRTYCAQRSPRRGKLRTKSLIGLGRVFVSVIACIFPAPNSGCALTHLTTPTPRGVVIDLLPED